MSEKTIYLIDMDGVIADFERGFLDSWRKKYSNRSFVPIEERTTFYAKDQYPKEFEKDVERISLERGFFFGLKPIKGSLDAISNLSKIGEVFICTSPITDNPSCADEKLLWIEKYLGREFRRKAIITKDKTLVRGDILIDDKPRITGIDLPVWEQVIYSQPYNLEIQKRRITWNNYKEVLGL